MLSEDWLLLINLL